MNEINQNNTFGKTFMSKKTIVFYCSKNRHGEKDIIVDSGWIMKPECCSIIWDSDQPERLSEKTSKDDAIV